MPQLTVLPTSCTAAKRNGEFCDRESLPDAPFPICVKHAAEVMRFLNSAMPDNAAEAVREMEKPEPTPTHLDAPGDELSVVYYVRVGNHIKVGYSSNLHQRMRFYPPDAELLAFEPGDRALENKRIKQFRKNLNMRREWFAPSIELLTHIRSVRAAYLGTAA